MDVANQIPVQSSTLEGLIEKCLGLLIPYFLEKKGIKDSQHTLALNISETHISLLQENFILLKEEMLHTELKFRNSNFLVKCKP